MVTRTQMDLTATDDYKKFVARGLFLIGFNEFLINNRSFVLKNGISQKLETNYFEKSLYFFIIRSLIYGNYRYALIMDKTLVRIIEEY